MSLRLPLCKHHCLNCPLYEPVKYRLDQPLSHFALLAVAARWRKDREGGAAMEKGISPQCIVVERNTDDEGNDILSSKKNSSIFNLIHSIKDQ
jgi:hypothetical protein